MINQNTDCESAKSDKPVAIKSESSELNDESLNAEELRRILDIWKGM